MSEAVFKICWARLTIISSKMSLTLLLHTIKTLFFFTSHYREKRGSPSNSSNSICSKNCEKRSTKKHGVLYNKRFISATQFRAIEFKLKIPTRKSFDNKLANHDVYIYIWEVAGSNWPISFWWMKRSIRVAQRQDERNLPGLSLPFPACRARKGRLHFLSCPRHVDGPVTSSLNHVLHIHLNKT